MSDENVMVLKLVERLREIREARGISQYRLSKETGLSRSGIRHMENGEVSPTLFFLLRICSFLNEDLPTLLAEADANAPTEKKTAKAPATKSKPQ